MRSTIKIDWTTLKTKLPQHVANPDPDVYLHTRMRAVVLDLETTTHRNGSAMFEENDIVLAVWRYLGVTYYNWGGCYEQDLLAQHVAECSYIVAHNAKFELQWLDRMGVDIGNKLVFCTMLAEYVDGGNRYSLTDISLDATAERRIGARKMEVCGLMYKSKQCSRDIPESWLLRYCKRDVDLCEQVWYNQLADLGSRNLLPVLYTRCLTCVVLADIEKNGMQLDSVNVTEKADVCEQEYKQLTRALAVITGDINTNSGDQLGAFIYDELGFDEIIKRKKPIRTPSGKRKTDQDTLLQLKARTPEQRVFLKAYKKHKAKYNELTKYLRKFSSCCSEAGGALRAVFNQTTTRTQRLSSSGLDYSTQFQNFPRDYKDLFVAREDGWLVGEGDGAQLEFRVAAHLGKDARALADIRGDVDIHSFTASIIGCDRQTAKADTFKPLYGGQSGTKKQMSYYAAFKEKYKGITATQQKWIGEVYRTGKLVTEWGLVYYWPGTTKSRSGYVSNTTSICNYPVQALATAEIIPIALVYCWHYIRALRARMFIVNSIHDSIIAELPPEERELFHELMRQCLIHEAGAYLKQVYKIDFVAPLGAGVKVDTHWGIGEEVKYED